MKFARSTKDYRWERLVIKSVVTQVLIKADLIGSLRLLQGGEVLILQQGRSTIIAPCRHEGKLDWINREFVCLAEADDTAIAFLFKFVTVLLHHLYQTMATFVKKPLIPVVILKSVRWEFSYLSQVLGVSSTKTALRILKHR